MSRLSLSRYLTETRRRQPTLDTSLCQLVEGVAEACKAIAAAIGKGGLAGVLGEAGSDNVQGEAQKKLDVISNQVLLDTNSQSGLLAGMASEEMEVPFPIPEGAPRGKYLLLFDPLDGSSNIDVNISVGTIFSILACPEGGNGAQESAYLQAGTRQVAAGYVVYGPATQLVLTLGAGVHSFTLDRETGTFLLTQENLRIPEETREFSINMSNQRFWEAPVQRYVAELQAGKTGPRGKDYNMRWVGSMVADVHRILTRGGVFLYPLDSKMQDKGGKLRLLYEANPMSLLVEQAGGAASTGRQPILGIAPSALHQRVPVILGSRAEVAQAVACHQEA